MSQTSNELLGVLGRSVKRQRELLGISQSELSRRSGIGQGTISKIEAGLMEPGVILMIRLNSALLKFEEKPWWLSER